MGPLTTGLRRRRFLRDRQVSLPIIPPMVLPAIQVIRLVIHRVIQVCLPIIRILPIGVNLNVLIPAALASPTNQNPNPMIDESRSPRPYPLSSSSSASSESPSTQMLDSQPSLLPSLLPGPNPIMPSNPTISMETTLQSVPSTSSASSSSAAVVPSATPSQKSKNRHKRRSPTTHSATDKDSKKEADPISLEKRVQLDHSSSTLDPSISAPAIVQTPIPESPAVHLARVSNRSHSKSKSHSSSSLKVSTHASHVGTTAVPIPSVPRVFVVPWSQLDLSAQVESKLGSAFKMSSMKSGTAIPDVASLVGGWRENPLESMPPINRRVLRPFRPFLRPSFRRGFTIV